jgi:hypothetical protein
MTLKQFTITKRIAKHGRQAIIVIPKLIEEHLKPGTIVELKIEIINSSVE